MFFGIDEEQISVFGKMENHLMVYARSSSTPVTLHDDHIKLGKSCVNYDLNYLAMNNPKVFPDYGSGYSETTKRTCMDFDFRSGYLNTKVILMLSRKEYDLILLMVYTAWCRR